MLPRTTALGIFFCEWSYVGFLFEYLEIIWSHCADCPWRHFYKTKPSLRTYIWPNMQPEFCFTIIYNKRQNNMHVPMYLPIYFVLVVYFLLKTSFSRHLKIHQAIKFMISDGCHHELDFSKMKEAKHSCSWKKKYNS